MAVSNREAVESVMLAAAASSPIGEGLNSLARASSSRLELPPPAPDLPPPPKMGSVGGLAKAPDEKADVGAGGPGLGPKLRRGVENGDFDVDVVVAAKGWLDELSIASAEGRGMLGTEDERWMGEDEEEPVKGEEKEGSCCSSLLLLLPPAPDDRLSPPKWGAVGGPQEPAE
mmetsp:Transcript_32054/g.68600  ORF Transcript_32054/g.68600 Transcript_32054/m.68600 type:complete len:172 (-) Transcript_32054:6-521(-)